MSTTKSFTPAIVTSVILLVIVTTTIVFGHYIDPAGTFTRRWYFSNLLYILPVVPLLFLQQPATLPPVNTINTKRYGWASTVLPGVMFGLLDVLVIKVLMHPQPYTELPPFLQPFPYSIFLYISGALEVEVYYRMLPLTLLLLANHYLFKGRFRKIIMILLGILTSLVEPVLQFPDGASWWLLAYATATGIAMNVWQFISYTRYGFLGSLAVRLGHYLVWHILLGLYVELFTLGNLVLL